MKFVGWDESEAKPKGHMFLKLESGKEYTIRFIANPYQFWQVWEPFPYRSPYMDETGKTVDPLLIDDPNIKVKERYSCWCIDRSDGKFKIVDITPTLKNKIVMWKKKFNDNPGGPKGPDWVISSTGTGINTKWEAMPCDRTPLTAEELAFVQGNDLRKMIEEVRKPDSPESIRTRWENFKATGQKGRTQKPGQQVQASVQPSAPPQVQQAHVVVQAPAAPPAAPAPQPTLPGAAPAKGDDAFSW